VGTALVYTADTMPGLRRRRAGSGFSYLDARGRRITCEATLSRIRRLAIPPAYTDVWICPDADGHLQATGRDARGRKQYRYHPAWHAHRGDSKFERIIAFAEAMPGLRRQINQHLSLSGFPRDKVIALVVALIGQTLLRVGNASYLKQNRSYGITTLRNAHARFIASGQVRFAFRGKGGRALESTVSDDRLVRLLRRCQQLPGQALFQYREGEQLHRVSSTDVNDYLQAHLGGPYTAKDFRTWGATLFAFRALAAIPAPGDVRDGAACTRVRLDVLRDTAAILGNTVRICEKSYVDPAVFRGWEDGSLHAAARRAKGPRQWEQAAIRFLKRAHRAPAARA
jgi:DNA topoisomerase IB